MNNKVRIGIVGGGLNSFMGNIHRQAILASDCAELVCGAFGSTRQSSFETGKALNLPTRRVYGTYRDMFRREASLPENERMQLTVILAPNTMHYPVAMSSIDAGFPIFSEKPFTCNIDEAMNLTRKQRNSGLAYGIAMNYAHYPMLQKARQLVQTDKALGNIRKIIATYPLGWLAQRLETAGNKQAGWRTDPRRCGPAGCLIDLGIHCFYVSEWVSGLLVSEVCADLRATVAGRILDDDCTIMLRFANGARGVFLASQIATGRHDGLSLQLFGDKGSLEWSQTAPHQLRHMHINGSQQILSDNNLENEPPPALTTTLPATTPFGDNAAYISALTRTYKAFAKYLTSDKKKSGAQSEEHQIMNITEGLRAVAFVDTVLNNTALPDENTTSVNKWTPFIVPIVTEL